ncbi:MAG: hypothetical protein RLZZ219_392 [Cyanobacteriota bacterium]|jgi:hypothetical protein
MKISQINGEYLICLNSKQALLLLRILEAASLHAPTKWELTKNGDAATLQRNLKQALLEPGPKAKTLGSD